MFKFKPVQWGVRLDRIQTPSGYSQSSLCGTLRSTENRAEYEARVSKISGGRSGPDPDACC